MTIGEIASHHGEFGDDDTTQGVAAISQGVGLTANAPQDTPDNSGGGVVTLPTVVVTGDTPATPSSPPAAPNNTSGGSSGNGGMPDMTIPIALGALGLGALALMLISRSK